MSYGHRSFLLDSRSRTPLRGYLTRKPQQDTPATRQCICPSDGQIARFGVREAYFMKYAL